MHIIDCTPAHLDTIAALFNEYRIFYDQADDLPACRAFIAENLEKRRAKIFLLADDDGKPVAFSQLYPAVCSVAMKSYYYLSDLYVVSGARRHGHARRLMEFLIAHFKAQGAQRLTLDTAASNRIARHLYQSLGYEKEEDYITYHRMLQD